MRYAIATVLAALAPAPFAAEEHSFDSNGVKIAYLDVGQRGRRTAPRVRNVGRGDVDEDAARPDSIRLRLEGLPRPGPPICGDTARAANRTTPKVYGKEMAEDVVRLLDHVKVKKAHVVGCSMGALIAGRLLVDHPDRLLGVTFGGGGPVYKPVKGDGPLDATIESLEKGKGIGPLMLALPPGGAVKPSD